MRLRIATAAALAVLAATSLTACRSNVGYAATIDGTRYSESDINDYITHDAQPVSRQDSSGAQVKAPVRSFVVETLISEKLLEKVATTLPSGPPSAADLATVRKSVLDGSSVSKAVRAAGIRGYSSSFDDVLVRRVVFSQYLQAVSQQGVDVTSIVSTVPFAVSVNPRYGVWNAKARTFDGDSGAGSPAFLKLQSTPATTASGTTGG